MTPSARVFPPFGASFLPLKLQPSAASPARDGPAGWHEAVDEVDPVLGRRQSAEGARVHLRWPFRSLSRDGAARQVGELRVTGDGEGHGVFLPFASTPPR